MNSNETVTGPVAVTPSSTTSALTAVTVTVMVTVTVEKPYVLLSGKNIFSSDTQSTWVVHCFAHHRHVKVD